MAALLAWAIVPSAGAADKPPPPYQPKLGEFPPADAARELAGELIQVDHVNRTGRLRPDRRDDQRTDDYDRPLPFVLLPYGAVRYHGAFAELRDVPLGTHLHGRFYFDPKAGKDGKGAYALAAELADDFSHRLRRREVWRIDALKTEKNVPTLSATLQADAGDAADAKAASQPATRPATQPAAKPVTFRLTAATRVWKGRGFGTPDDLAVGQTVLLNLTNCTLTGPGDATDVWLDDATRALAAEQQAAVHRVHVKARGLPGWVDAVDNSSGLVTATLFGTFDPALADDLKPGGRLAALVAEPSLRSYDQINDRMYAKIVEVRPAPPAVGSGGVQIVFKPDELLEGFRPRRVVRLLSEKWPLGDLPWEERLWPGGE